jgi:hypothetical protein
MSIERDPEMSVGGADDRTGGASGVGERVSKRRARRVRVGAAACFLLTGFVSASWASRVPAIKDGLGLSDGQFAIALIGLEAGASLLVFSGTLLGPGVAPSLLVLAASLFLFAVLNSVADVAMNAQGVAVQRLMGRPVLSFSF